MCGGRSQHVATRAEILNIVAAVLAAGAGGVLYETVDSIQRSTSWLIFSCVLVFGSSVILLRWTFGRLTSLPK
jgi:hypothetical protein